MMSLALPRAAAGGLKIGPLGCVGTEDAATMKRRRNTYAWWGRPASEARGPNPRIQRPLPRVLRDGRSKYLAAQPSFSG